jgi:general stress protein 26
MSNDDPHAPEILPIAWPELRQLVEGTGDGLFLATADETGLPHVAFVSPGWADERLWISTFANSRKAANLRQRADVALTCAPSPETNLLIRARARLVVDPAETARLWSAGVLPYDPSAFFSGPEDPLTLFVEIVPTVATIHPLGPGPWHRWRAS